MSQRDTQGPPVRHQVIRRVHAVIEVPVKEEDNDDDDNYISEAQSVGSTYEPESGASSRKAKSMPKTKAKRRASTTNTPGKGKQAARDEDDDDFDNEQPRRRSTNARRRTVPDEDDEDEEDEDDELIIGAEVLLLLLSALPDIILISNTLQDNHNEVYGTKRVIVTSEINTPQRQRTAPAGAGGRSTAANTKKRKLDGGESANRGISAKVARKKQ